TSRQSGPLASESEEALNNADIILRFPRESANRKHVERLRFEHEQLGMVNYVVRKFDLSVQDISRLLDEDGIFTEAGDLLLDELQLRASQHSRQDRKRQEEQQVQAAKVVALRQREASTPEEPPAEQAVEMEFYVEVPPQFTAKCDIHQYNMMLR
ncbi:helicase DnaB, partial [Bacillus cereus]|nr:helicase DnaB [Bacillus cereus]